MHIFIINETMLMCIIIGEISRVVDIIYVLAIIL
jgi:hypothetical protein